MPRPHRIVLVYRERAVTVEVYAAEPGPMGVAGPEVSAAVKQMLEAKGISYHPEHQVRSVDAKAKRLGFGECFIEIGGGKAGYGGGDFYAEPTPAVNVRPPGRRWHLAKVLLEKSWLHLRL